MSFSAGDKLGRYVLEGLLGEGGMGHVYVAFDPLLDRRVALKILRTEAGGTDPARDAAVILREARAAAALDHPNAVAIYEVGEAEGTQYIAMERVQGRSLRAYVGDRSVPLERRVRWLVEIGRALAAAHERGLVHRDIKPENVMVRDDGSIKVLDFGIARRAHAPAGALEQPIDPTGSTMPALVATGHVTTRSGGTPPYMAPEQLRGGKLDGRTDEFAWGVVAYELMTGAIPWRSTDASTLIADIFSKVPAPVTSSLPEVPPAVDAAILKALSKAMDDRFPSMNDALAALAMPEGFNGSSRSLASIAPYPSGSQDMALNRTLPDGGVGALTDRSRPWRVPWVLAGAVALAASGALLVWKRSPEPRPVNGHPSPVPTRVIDLALPASNVPKALDAYKLAIQSDRDGADALHMKNLEEAVELDPALGAAHLRLAISSIGWSITDAREEYQKALLQRANLTPRDRELLEAFEPFLAHDPPDLGAVMRRLRALAEKYPGDAELENMLAGMFFLAGDFEGAKGATERALEIDPDYGAPRVALGEVLGYLGDTAGSRRAYDECLARFPSASSCLALRGALADQTGDCATAENDARATIVINPSGWVGYHALAQAELALGRPREAVLETFKLKWSKLSAAQRYREVADTSTLAVFDGDFAAAEKHQQEFIDVIKPIPDELAHEAAARRYVEILSEEGKPAEAARVADDFLKRRAAWTPEVLTDDLGLGRDPRVRLAAAAYRGGLTTREAFETARTDWLGAWRGKLARSYAGYLWIHAYAMVAETPEEAKGALDVLAKSFPVVPAYGMYANLSAYVGKVYVLAGEPKEALSYLDRAVANCRVFDNPFEHVQAYYWRGEAEAALGKKREACADDAAVLGQWGHAKPRSAIATAARGRMKALGCGGSEGRGEK